MPVSAQHGQDGQATASLVARASCPCRPSMARMAMPQRVWWHGHLARVGPAWPGWPGHPECGRFAPLRTLGELHGFDLGHVLTPGGTPGVGLCTEVHSPTARFAPLGSFQNRSALADCRSRSGIHHRPRHRLGLRPRIPEPSDPRSVPNRRRGQLH